MSRESEGSTWRRTGEWTFLALRMPAPLLTLLAAAVLIGEAPRRSFEARVELGVSLTIGVWLATTSLWWVARWMFCTRRPWADDETYEEYLWLFTRAERRELSGRSTFQLHPSEPGVAPWWGLDSIMLAAHCAVAAGGVIWFVSQRTTPEWLMHVALGATMGALSLFVIKSIALRLRDRLLVWDSWDGGDGGRGHPHPFPPRGETTRGAEEREEGRAA